MKVKIKQATRMIELAIKAKCVPMMYGSPAIGKSAVGAMIAANHNLKMIDFRLAQADVTDLNGFPSIKNNKAHYVPMSTFPIENDPLPLKPDGSVYNGWLLFLDEFNSAPRAVQAAAYKLVLDRMVGEYKIHPNVAIICAGNKEDDGAIVEEMSTAMQSRLVHLELVADAKEWNEWAVKAGIDYRITSFINFKPGLIYNFRPNHSDHTYAAPRTWEMADRQIKANKGEVGDEDIRALLGGTIGEGVAYEFITYCKIFKELPTIAQIIDAPNAILMPEEPSVLFALTGSISHYFTEDNADLLMKFIKRMPIEFQIVCMRECFVRNDKLITIPAVMAWATLNAGKLF